MMYMRAFCITTLAYIVTYALYVYTDSELSEVPFV